MEFLALALLGTLCISAACCCPCRCHLGHGDTGGSATPRWCAGFPSIGAAHAQPFRGTCSCVTAPGQGWARVPREELQGDSIPRAAPVPPCPAGSSPAVCCRSGSLLCSLVKFCSLSWLVSAGSSTNTFNYLNLQHEVEGDFSNTGLQNGRVLIAPAAGE